jgi:homogentisate phytyltransferase/homogentisate geranylgeranyltransferase
MIRHLWLFTRPQTILASGTSVLMLYIITAHTAHHWPNWFWLSLVSAVFCNLFITGFNQLTDIHINRRKVTTLPVPSAALSERMGKIFVAGTLIFSLVIASMVSWYYTFFMTAISGIGFMYSWKKIHSKKRHELSALAIIIVRGILINLGFSLHFLYMLDMPLVIPNGVWLLTAGLFFFSLGISWFKDIPSIKSDRNYDIQSLEVTAGILQSFKGGVVAVFTGYLITILVAIFTDIPLVNNGIIIAGQSFLALIFLMISKRTKPNEHKSINRFYNLFWLLIPLTYLVFGLSAISLF